MNLNKVKIRITTSLLAIAMVLLVVSLLSITPVTASDNTLGIFGNANEDDTINMQDVTYTELIILEYKDATELADAKYDGEIDILDMTQIALIILGREKELTLVDDTDRIVTVSKPIERVVGVEAGALRLIVYLGAADRVVGVEDVEKPSGSRPYSIAHPELAELPSIGPIHGGDDELILAQHPDVIFWTYTTAEEADERQEKTGIPVIVFSYGALAPESEKEKYYTDLRLMGSVLDEEKRAEELIDYTEKLIQDLDERTSDIPEEEKPRGYVGGIGYRGAHGILSTEPSYPPFVFVHANNVASELGVEHAFIDKEQLIDWNPDMKNGELYGVMPYNWYTHNYGTTLADAYYVGEVLYPDRFADMDAEEKADEIYEKYVGAPVYEQMKSEFGGFKKIEL